MSDKSNIVFTGSSLLTSVGHGWDENLKSIEEGRAASSHADYTLDGFKPAPHLSDKRVLKAISPASAYGVVAVEDASKDTGLQADSYDTWKKGIYVGATPPSVNDNSSYFRAMEQATDENGQISEAMFGETFTCTKPTTLLEGLPNNVLCYGALILDAKGPNSNYTSMETSSHIAIQRAAKSIARGKLDYAMAGGYTKHSRVAEYHAYKVMNYLTDESVIDPYGSSQGTVMGDGATFVSMERRETAEARGASVFATYLGGALTSEAGGPGFTASSPEPLERCMQAALAQAGAKPSDIGIVFVTGYGLKEVDRIEKEAVERVFADESPAVATTSKIWGNLMEAGGVAEIKLAKYLMDESNDVIPETLRAFGAINLDRTKRKALILRVSPQGEYSTLLVGIA